MVACAADNSSDHKSEVKPAGQQQDKGTGDEGKTPLDEADISLEMDPEKSAKLSPKAIWRLGVGKS